VFHDGELTAIRRTRPADEWSGYVVRLIGRVYQAINLVYAETVLSARKASGSDRGTQVKSTPLQ
jgi:hypothetical protein